VAQVYVGDPAAAGEPPEQLQGFARVTLNPGQTRHVVITLAPRAFDGWDAAAQRRTTQPGRYTISAGGSSVNLPLQASIAR
jgi:beta-glucosidase